MTFIFLKFRFLILCVMGLLLIGCGAKKAESIGFWKADDRNFIEIVENGGSYSATIYRPSSFDGTFEKGEFSATFADGGLTINMPHNPLSVLYKPEQDVVILFGDTTYSRVDAETTRFEVNGKLQKIELDKKDCEDLQSQINAARDTFESKNTCQIFMDRMKKLKPKKCRLYYTSCNSF